jgi:DNA modification methylase
MTNLRIENVNISSLSFDPTNARKHDKKNLEAIAGSLKLFGQRKPIVVTGANVIVAGNGTVEAAKSLGWSEVSIVRIPIDWTTEQVKAYALADNRTAELAEWDSKVLADQLIDLDAVGWDVAEFGFDALEPPISSMDDEPLNFDEAPSRAKLGDYWIVGNHHIICGDSSDKATRKRFNKEFEFIVTDPPYGINAEKMNLGGTSKNYNKFHRGEWDSFKPEITWILEESKTAIIWGGNYFANSLPETNHWLCWHKKITDMSFSEFELAWTNLGRQARILSHHWSGEKKNHPTMKPLPVMIWCLDFLPNGVDVFDPFLGSGSTLVACERTKRNGYGIELDPKYVDVILDRLEKETGLEASRLEQ